MTTSTAKKVYTSEASTASFRADQRFDDQQMRHYVNGACSVLHCHHYATLFTQLATDAENFDGPAHLVNAAAETIYPVLHDYFDKQGLTAVEDRLAVAEQWWSFVGMGQARFTCEDWHGTVSMKHSHVDEGWLKKWGQRDSRVNFIGEGYIKASCAAVFSVDWKSVSVNETQSIVCGASTSRFDVTW